MLDKSLKIALAGCGNVATRLALGLESAGIEPVGIYGRNPATVRCLVERLVGRKDIACGSFADIASSGADIVLVSVADSALSEVAAAIGRLAPGTVALHTSGTVGMDVLAGMSDDHGIIYPLQTFSRDVEVDLSAVPFFTEGSTPRALEAADNLAAVFSENVTHADAAHRRALHIAGVLSCNFPNYLLECARKVLAGAGFSLDVVAPLVRATMDKAFAIGPHDAQTGPARRGDVDVMRAQAASLPPDIAAIYRSLSREIMISHDIPQKNMEL